MMGNEDNLKHMQQQLIKMDYAIEPDIPDADRIIARLQEHQIQQKRRLLKELGLFLVIAVFVMAVMFKMYQRLFPAFVVLQALVVIGPLLLVWLSRDRKRKRHSYE